MTGVIMKSLSEQKPPPNYLESSHAAVHLVQTAHCWQLPILLKPQIEKVKGRADISLRPR